jgi:uncharacterized protein DUF5818
MFMRLRLMVALMTFFLLAGTVSLAKADDKDKDGDKARTLTGCLQKGDSANEYELTAKDGSTWELRSDGVDLAPHVGQTVTITGERLARPRQSSRDERGRQRRGEGTRRGQERQGARPPDRHPRENGQQFV